jgi:GAF domain-containing protein
VHVPDLSKDRAYLEREPLAVWAVEQAHKRTVLVVPILKREELVGVFGLEREEVKPVHRQANRASADFRGSGRHRHRERAAAQ